jgi:hypothetical protein
MSLALLAGCGDDDNDALSYDETGNELSAICQKYDTAAEEENVTGDPENDAEVLRGINDKVSSALEEIRELEVNEELVDARDEFVEVGEASLERGETLQQLAEDGDRRAYLKQIREYQRASGDLAAEADASASALGAPACGQNE